MFVGILRMLRIKTVIRHLKELIQMKLIDTETSTRGTYRRRL